jgi:hypothetical protein
MRAIALFPSLVAVTLLGACGDNTQFKACPECKLVGVWRTMDAGAAAANYTAYFNTLSIYESLYTLHEEATWVATSSTRAGCASYTDSSGSWSGADGRLALTVVSATRQLSGCKNNSDNKPLGDVGPSEFPALGALASGPYVLAGSTLTITVAGHAIAYTKTTQ